MNLSVIIINWNSADYMRTCIGTLIEKTIGIDFEIIVIDNGSFDRCESMIRNEFPTVRFFQSVTNLGFGKANNYGSEKAAGDYLLFLNPDTELIDNALHGMLSIIKSLPAAGVLGCKLLNSDQSLQTSCVQPFPTVLNQVFDSDLVHQYVPVMSRHRMWQSDGIPKKVQAISGACLMIKRKIFEEIGKFSPEYFMYTEDLDLCYKADRAGYSNYYTDAYSVIHHGGGSSHKRKENSYANIQMRESVYKFLKKTRGGPYAEVYKKAMLINGIIRCLLLSIFLAPSLLTGREAKWKSSLRKWKGIIRWTLGAERWAR